MNTFTEDLIHGIAVSDPYRWLEDRGSPDTEVWIQVQQERCEAYFSKCPELAAMESRVREYLDVEIVDQPAQVADRYFYRKRSRGQEQGCLRVREGANCTERVLVDPTAEGRFVSVGIYRISHDAGLLAYEIKRGGEDRREIRIRDVNRGVDLPDCIPLGYACGFVFAKEGYFYVQETDPDSLEHTIRYHRFGSTEPDSVVFRVPRTAASRLIVTGNAQRLGVVWMRPQGAEAIVDFAIAGVNERPTWHAVFSERSLPCGTILYRDRIFAVVETASQNSKVIELSLDGREMRTLIPEKNGVLQQIVVAQDRIFVSYLMENATTTMEVWLTTGERVGTVPVPTGGTIQIQPVYDESAESVFYTFESFNTPPTLYEHDVQTHTSNVWHQRRPADRTGSCSVQEANITSKDGTTVPLTIVSIAQVDAAVPGPVMMTSYGGFGVSMTPQFSVLVAIMMELGAVFVIPHIRGGGDPTSPPWRGRGASRGCIWECPSRIGRFRSLQYPLARTPGPVPTAVLLSKKKLYLACSAAKEPALCCPGLGETNCLEAFQPGHRSWPIFWFKGDSALYACRRFDGACRRARLCCTS